MHGRAQGRLVAGAILILIGIGLMAQQLLGGFGQGATLLLIGGVL